MKERKIPFEIKMLDNMIDRKICKKSRKNNKVKPYYFFTHF